MTAEVGKIQTNGKLPYETPVVTVEGSFESVTQHSSFGRRFDVAFNANDPVPDPLDIFS
jgi:hypothetical protein